MSIVPFETVRGIAETQTLGELSDDVAKIIASDLEYRLREITQVVPPFRHSSALLA